MNDRWSCGFHGEKRLEYRVDKKRWQQRRTRTNDELTCVNRRSFPRGRSTGFDDPVSQAGTSNASRH